MSPEIWSIVSAVIVILIAIAAANRALRQEMNLRFGQVRQEMNERFGQVRQEVNERFGQVDQRFGQIEQRFGQMEQCIAGLRTEMVERFGELTERLGRVEGFLEGYALRRRAGKKRSDGEHGPVPPQP